jgi:GTP-binding protein
MVIKVLNANFVGSYPKVMQLPPQGVPELVLLGRSNVGKSSLINRLVGRKQLAKTSNTPGKTRMMNLYTLEVSPGGASKNMALQMIDLPGYGYAKVSKTQQQGWQKEFEKLMMQRTSLALYVMIVDARHGVQENDWQMLDWLITKERGPIRIVISKMDKLKQSERKKAITQVHEVLKPEEKNWILPFSAETGEGFEPVWHSFLNAIEASVRVAASNERIQNQGAVESL